MNRKKIVLFLALTLASAILVASDIVKPKIIGTDYDTTTYVLLKQDYLKNIKSDQKIKVFNSADILIEETFCYILNKDSLSCIANKVKANSEGQITRVIRKPTGKIKQIVVSFIEKDYTYHCYFFRSKDAYGNEEYVLNGQVELYFRGKTHKITSSTLGICKILVKK